LLLKAAVRNPSIKGSWTSALGQLLSFNNNLILCPVTGLRTLPGNGRL
jgi:hypothetical protein